MAINATKATKVEYKSMVFSIFCKKICMDFFFIYCSKSQVSEETTPIAKVEPKLAQNVVLDLINDIQEKEHVIVMDNVFEIAPSSRTYF